MPCPVLRCLALLFGMIIVMMGVAVRLPLRALPPSLFIAPLFEAGVAPCGAYIGAVLLSSITCAAHTLQVVDVVVWWVAWDDVVYCPVVAL